MSDYVPKPGTFTLFKNEYKEKENQPDYKGDGAGVDGTPLEIAGWIKESRNGKKFISLKVQEPREKGDSVPQASPKQMPKHELDDFDDSDIPF